MASALPSALFGVACPLQLQDFDHRTYRVCAIARRALIEQLRLLAGNFYDSFVGHESGPAPVDQVFIVAYDRSWASRGPLVLGERSELLCPSKLPFEDRDALR